MSCLFSVLIESNISTQISFFKEKVESSQGSFSGDQNSGKAYLRVDQGIIRLKYKVFQQTIVFDIISKPYKMSSVLVQHIIKNFLFQDNINGVAMPKTELSNRNLFARN